MKIYCLIIKIKYFKEIKRSYYIIYQLLDADFVPVDELIAGLNRTSKMPDNEYAKFDRNKLEATRRFKKYMKLRKAYEAGTKMAEYSFIAKK